ncbi:serum paraoxonase/lactonase 3-like [Saccostrea cucullata]|uniref:serum paraoxonase/lactonase 3-like n=1 Tax=Saccostrea cuccullata TaxID=36930 RepID=UPI002ED4A088
MIFKRESNNRLTKVNEIPVDTVPDNLVVDPKTGDLLLGCHPIVFKTAHHLDNPVEPAASQVLMLHMDSNGTNLTGITELFSDDLELYGSTVATLYKNRMLIGTILHKMMYCEVNIL